VVARACGGFCTACAAALSRRPKRRSSCWAAARRSSRIYFATPALTGGNINCHWITSGDSVHRSLHDAVDLVPAQSQLLAHGLDGNREAGETTSAKFFLERCAQMLAPSAATLFAHSALRLCNHAGYAALWQEQLGGEWREPQPRYCWPVLADDHFAPGSAAAIDAAVAHALWPHARTVRARPVHLQPPLVPGRAGSLPRQVRRVRQHRRGGLHAKIRSLLGHPAGGVHAPTRHRVSRCRSRSLVSKPKFTSACLRFFSAANQPKSAILEHSNAPR
jgi:hypothetical protein